MSDFPYLGNRISLISSSQIRYEGILYTIDTVQGTVTLAQVRSFGTEDRPTERPVAERDEVYDFIVFRGSDIKDIKLCPSRKTYDDPAIVEMGSSTSSAGAVGGPVGPPPAAAAAPRPPQQPAFGAPAFGGGAAAVPEAAGGGFGVGAVGGVARLPSASAAPGGPVTSSESTAGLVTGGGTMDYVASSQPPAGETVHGSSRSTTPSRKSPTIDQGVQTNQERHRNRDGQRGGYQRGGGGGYRGPRGGRRGGRGGQSRGSFPPPRGEPIKFDEDFDFEESNKKFEELAAQLMAKAKIADGEQNGEVPAGEEELEDGEIGAEKPEEPTVVYYDRAKSFFDKISCDALEKRDNRQRRQDWQKERKQNLETFGVESTRRGFRRGGYRGGYYNNYNRTGGYYNNRGGGGYYNNYNRGGYYNNYNRGGGYFNRGWGYGGGGRRGSGTPGGGGGGGGFRRGGRVNGQFSRDTRAAGDTAPAAEKADN